jgi:hypothetical protein
MKISNFFSNFANRWHGAKISSTPQPQKSTLNPFDQDIHDEEHPANSQELTFFGRFNSFDYIGETDLNGIPHGNGFLIERTGKIIVFVVKGLILMRIVPLRGDSTQIYL